MYSRSCQMSFKESDESQRVLSRLTSTRVRMVSERHNESLRLPRVAQWVLTELQGRDEPQRVLRADQ